ncbi:MAG TPA: MFS transporter [Streptosporangiaceae bacterium]|jgi:MFS family permease
MSTATSSPASSSAASPAAQNKPATYGSVFAVAEFRVLFAGMLMYVLGFEFEILGLSVIVYAQTRSAFLAAFAFSMGFVPQVVGGALFTSLADRLPPRTVITAGLLLRALPGLLIGLLPSMPVAAMLAMVAAAASITPVFSAAISGLLPDVLDGDRYVLGRSVLSLLSSGTQILGLGVAGVVLAVLPARDLLLAAGIALVLSALVRRGVRARPARAAGPISIRGTIRATMAGNGRLFRDNRVRGLLLAQWLPIAFVSGAESLVVPYIGSVGGGSVGGGSVGGGSVGAAASAAGPLLAAGPAGMLIGNWLVGRFCRPAIRRRLALPLALLTTLPWLVFLGHPPLWVLAVAMFASGAGIAYELAIQQAFLDSVPAELRGQAFGLNSTGAMSGQGVGPWLTGALAGPVGPAGAMAVAAGAGIACVLALYRPLTGLSARGTRRRSRGSPGR